MKTPSEALLPSPDEDPVLWKLDLIRALDDHLRAVYQDLRYGASTHRVLSAIPAVDDLEEGEVVFLDDGVNRRMYTRLNSVLRYAALT